MLGWHSSSCELFAIKIFINAREWPCESKAFHYFRHLVCQGDRPNVVFNRLGRHLFTQGEHNCVFQRRRYNTFTQRGIIHISNQWRKFKGELLEYYIRYTIWSRHFLDFCLPKSNVGFTHGYKEIGGDSLDSNMDIRHVRGREWGKSSSETGKEIVNTFTQLRNRGNNYRV